MSTMASQITSLMIVYSTVYSGADQRKHQSSASLALVTGEFPLQRATNAENASIWWRHHAILPFHSRANSYASGLINDAIRRHRTMSTLAQTMPNDTALSELMLTSHHLGSATFTWGQFRKRCLWQQLNQIILKINITYLKCHGNFPVWNGARKEHSVRCQENIVSFREYWFHVIYQKFFRHFYVCFI